jgi:hypothetical protein
MMTGLASGPTSPRGGLIFACKQVIWWSRRVVNRPGCRCGPSTASTQNGSAPWTRATKARPSPSPSPGVYPPSSDSAHLTSARSQRRSASTWGYVSRLVSQLERAGRLRRAQAEDDCRRRVASLTAKGRRLLEAVEQRSNERRDALTAHLRPSQVKELLEAMGTIRRLLSPDGAS